MLTLKVGTGNETFNEKTNLFGNDESFELDLEHSLVSMSKWESRFEKPFLSDDPKTSEETLWYVKAMVLTPDVPPEVFDKLAANPVQIAEINLYIGAKMTATTFRETPQSRSGDGSFITNEIIYYWMVELNIDWEAQWWHLNRLLTLIRVINEKRKPPRKMGRQEQLQKMRELNARRRAEMGTKG